MSHIFDEFILHYAINLEKTFEKTMSILRR